jgi:hypothetical protein
MMDGRISVAPSAFWSAWQDTALMAPRRPQPQVLPAAVQASEPPSDAAAGQPGLLVNSAAQDDFAGYDFRGRQSASAGLFAAARWERTDAIELQVTTAEGDIATLSFSQFSSASMAAGAVRDGGASATALAWDTASDETMDLSIVGDLNEQELAAIDALAEKLAQVAEEFFDGDLDAALSSAGQISISEDTQTLSAFSYSMRSQEVLAATALYERVAQAAEEPAGDGETALISPVPVGGSELAETGGDGPLDLLKQILDLLQSLVAENAAEPDELPETLLAQAEEAVPPAPTQDAPLTGA